MPILYPSPFDYENAASDQTSFFYSSPSETPQTEILKIPPLPEGWIRQSSPSWEYVMNSNKNFPAQGWKIHLSTSTTDLQPLLFDTAKYLFNRGISFKYVPTTSIWVAKNAKYANRGYSGKFITIYPSSTEEFISLLHPLKQLTDNYDLGPSILNDQEWQQSNVYFRYGGLKMMQTTINGNKIDIIHRPDGTPIEDQRVPYFVLPDFVSLPVYVQKNNTTYKLPQSNPFWNYKILKALHFSNSGGVYLAEYKDHKIVLKEGRPKSGLDGVGNDGFHRTRNEFAALKMLNDISGIVSVHQYFTAWRHCFFSEDFIEGQTLSSFIRSSYPFAVKLNRSDIALKYANKCLSVMNQLQKTLIEIHHQGLALCDISPSNVIITRNNKAVIIDAETAQPASARFQPILMTRGYFSPRATTAAQQDWFAWERILNDLFFPSNSITDLAPAMETERDQVITGKFGERIMTSIRFLREFAEHRTETHSILSIPHPLQPLTLNRQQWKMGLAKGLINALNKTNGKVPADVSQNLYTFGNTNIATGISGVLVSLDGLSSPRTWSDKTIEEIHSNLVNTFTIASTKTSFSSNDWGFFSGIAGLCATKYSARSIKFLVNKQNVILQSCKEDISLYSGLSGIGLALLAQPHITNQIKYFLNRIVQSIETKFAKEVQQQTHHFTDYGLLTGWGGAALFLWKYSLLFHNDQTRSITFTIVKNAISATKVIQTREKKTLSRYPIHTTSTSKGNATPYLENGSAGLLILLIEIMKDDTNNAQEFTQIIEELASSIDTSVSYNPGLLNGYSGLLPAANAYASVTGNKDILNHLIQNLKYHLLQNDEDILVPGWQGYKCSSDYISGSAGVLLALRSIDSQSRWDSWFPMKSKKLALFRSDIHIENS